MSPAGDRPRIAGASHDLHAGGKRRRGRFVVVACAAVPEALVQTELFSAHGSIAAAEGGTLFLDDVDQASPALQARLAQLVETRVLTGGREPVPLDCRIIGTAGEEQSAGPAQITPALFYRLAGMRLQVPPLRDRMVEDVPVLFAHFLSEAAIRLRRPVPEIDATVRDRLLTGRWPGNVRELASFAIRWCSDFSPREQREGPVPTRCHCPSASQHSNVTR